MWAVKSVTPTGRLVRLFCRADDHANSCKFRWRPYNTYIVTSPIKKRIQRFLFLLVTMQGAEAEILPEKKRKESWVSRRFN